MFICARLVGQQCAEWVALSDAFGLSQEEGIRVGSMFLGLCIFAWLGRMLITSLKRI